MKPLLVIFLALDAHNAVGQGTAFTIQAQLLNSGVAANGRYDLQCGLYTNDVGGDTNGPSMVISNVTVQNGLVTTTVDFGQGVFTGANYWLDIAVRTNGGTAFVELSPRQALTPTPYAIYAATAGVALSGGPVALGQLPNAVVTNNAYGLSLNGSFCGDMAGGTNFNPAALPGWLPELAAGDAAGLSDLEAGSISIATTSTNCVIISPPLTNGYVSNPAWGYAYSQMDGLGWYNGRWFAVFNSGLQVYDARWNVVASNTVVNLPSLSYGGVALEPNGVNYDVTGLWFDNGDPTYTHTRTNAVFICNSNCVILRTNYLLPPASFAGSDVTDSVQNITFATGPKAAALAALNANLTNGACLGFHFSGGALAAGTEIVYAPTTEPGGLWQATSVITNDMPIYSCGGGCWDPSRGCWWNVGYRYPSEYRMNPPLPNGGNINSMLLELFQLTLVGSNAMHVVPYNSFLCNNNGTANSMPGGDGQVVIGVSNDFNTVYCCFNQYVCNRVPGPFTNNIGAVSILQTNTPETIDPSGNAFLDNVVVSGSLLLSTNDTIGGCGYGVIATPIAGVFSKEFGLFGPGGNMLLDAKSDTSGSVAEENVTAGASVVYNYTGGGVWQISFDNNSLFSVNPAGWFVQASSQLIAGYITLGYQSGADLTWPAGTYITNTGTGAGIGPNGVISGNGAGLTNVSLVGANTVLAGSITNRSTMPYLDNPVTANIGATNGNQKMFLSVVVWLHGAAGGSSYCEIVVTNGGMARVAARESDTNQPGDTVQTLYAVLPTNAPYVVLAGGSDGGSASITGSEIVPYP